MPNGRTGGFLVGRGELETLLRALPPDTVIGKTNGTSVTAAQALISVAADPHEEILIEEQDHAWYLIHVSPWISAGATTELFQHLRERQAEWLKHPRERLAIPATPTANDALPLGVKPKENEAVVVSRKDYPSRDGEISAVTNLRIIAVGTSWPGPNFFDYSVPIDDCVKIEYQRRTHWVSFLIGCLMVLSGVWGLVWSYRTGAHWFVVILLVLVVLIGLPRLFRLRSAAILFHCEKEIVRWSFASVASHEVENVASKLLPFARQRGIAISNFSDGE